jgi:hypothetical protein
VTWSGTWFVSADVRLTVTWQWASVVYTSFPGSYSDLGVKPVDDPRLSPYQNVDHAGTPEHVRQEVTGGARGGGGSNFTGGYLARPACRALATRRGGGVGERADVEEGAARIRGILFPFRAVRLRLRGTHASWKQARFRAGLWSVWGVWAALPLASFRGPDRSSRH